ncbi:hypothetical protein FWH58_01320 [Candidatus Saccharibacteria bacterium]|nr:hypothetical protein [Candidatus Saccharibacteria bacterium]
MARLTDDEIARLVRYMEKRFKESDAKHDVAHEKLFKRFDRVDNILDGLVGDVKALKEENDVRAYATRRIDDALDDHESRIKQLENLELGRQAA